MYLIMCTESDTNELIQALTCVDNCQWMHLMSMRWRYLHITWLRHQPAGPVGEYILHCIPC
jgi:hypothetical protein